MFIWKKPLLDFDMKKILFIWGIGVLLNILMIWFEVYFLDYFSEKLIIPTLWVVINFVPLSLAIAYYTFHHIAITSNRIPYWLLLFLGLCLVSLFSRSLLADYDSFENAIRYVPFILLPIQIIILLQLIKAGKMRHQFDIAIKSENREQVIQHIQRGDTPKALDILLEESKGNEKIYEYLSLQKSALLKIRKQHLANTIENKEYQRTVNKITQSLLDLLII